MARIGAAFGGGMPPTDIVECVKLAEELGYESAWVTEGHGGDQFAILTACALATERILLGTAISSVYVRSAPTIAMAAACVDHFSKGRFILGLGSSHKVQVVGEHGLPYSRPIQNLTETVEVVRALLRDGGVSHSGEILNIDRFDLWFQPIRNEIPIYFAAVFPKMIEICGELAQGTILVWSTLDNASRAARDIAEGAKKAGRNPEDVDVGCLLPCSVSSDGRQARDPIRGIIADYAGFFPRYNRVMAESGFADEMETVRDAWKAGGKQKAAALVSDGLVDAVSLAGTPEECRSRIEEYRRSGITLPIIFPSGGGISATGGPMEFKDVAMEALRACAPE